MSGEKRCGPHCKEQVGHQQSWRSFKGGNALNNFALYSLCRDLAIWRPFGNIVLIILLYFLKMCVSEKICENIYNII